MAIAAPCSQRAPVRCRLHPELSKPGASLLHDATTEGHARIADLQQLILRHYARALGMRGGGLGRAMGSGKLSPAK